MKTRRQKLDEILKSYITAFEKKQGVEFEFAVSDNLMGLISFGGIYYIHIDDIVYDIDKKLKKGLIFKWLEDSLEQKGEWINLHSYATGLRYEDL